LVSITSFQQSIAMTSTNSNTNNLNNNKATNDTYGVMSPSTHESTRRTQKNTVPALVPSQVIHGKYIHSKHGSEKITNSYHKTAILSEDAIKNWVLLGTLNAKIQAQPPSRLFAEDDKSTIFTVNSRNEEHPSSMKSSKA
jgi:hypothetical protein